MAVIARRTLLGIAAAAILKAADDPSAKALAVINRFTTALSGADAAGAIEVFDKSCPDYDKLSAYFAALTNSFAITNEADVMDEKSFDTTVALTMDWTLTLQSLSSATSLRREEQVVAEVALKTAKIIGFSPAELFNPARAD